MSTPLAARYLIRRKLGEGGMAEVLEAVAQGEAGFTRRVAVKRLRSGHEEDPSFSRMFLDEARIASRLHHGSIVSVLDYGVVDGTPFQILEYVDGENARALAKRGARLGKPMPLEVALYLVTELARALHYAHTLEEGGVVHRDVKPANILVSRTGDVKLADFGIAFATERSERTEAGVAKGTPGYMSPEQLLGGAVDARADVFALGCTLHALAFGDSPLATVGNAERMLRSEPLFLSEDIPDDVRAIIARAIEPLPSRRWTTAGEMADALGAVLASRLRSDAKGALLGWLGSLGEERAPATLDAMLMPEALLENEGGSWRLETTRHEPPPNSRDDVPVVAASPAPRRAWIAYVAIVAVAVAAAVAGVAAFMRFRSPKVEHTVELAPTVPTATTTTSSELAPIPSKTIAPEPEPTHAATIIARPRPTQAVQVQAASASASSVMGTLAVRGGDYRGATVVIDGQVEPFGAPHFFDLPIGKHAIELRKDGAVVSHGTVDVQPDHTPTRPIYFP
jgi:serine/threonine-protein kinase